MTVKALIEKLRDFEDREVTKVRISFAPMLYHRRIKPPKGVDQDVICLEVSKEPFTEGKGKK